jgi:glycosyltransferase involved in cell wall biosynthesis
LAHRRRGCPFRIPILNRLKKKGFDVAAVGSENSDQFAENGIQFHYYSLDRGLAPFSDLKSKIQLQRLFQTYKPDIVHAFDTKPGLIVPSAAQNTPVKAVFRTITGMGYVFSTYTPLALMLRPIYKSFQKQASRRSDKTIFQNTDDLAFFLNNKLVIQGKEALIRSSGLDIDSFVDNVQSEKKENELKKEFGIESSIVVTMITRVVKDKGVFEFLESARQVRQTNQNIKFILVGPLDENSSQAIRRTVIDRYREDVLYVGKRDDIPTLLSIADIFVFPSYREGFPRVLLEAAAFKLPIVTTNVPGCREVVTHDYNGFLVKPRNIGELSDAIVDLTKSSEKRKIMGGRSYNYVKKHFDLSVVVEAYSKMYTEILAQEYEKAV